MNRKTILKGIIGTIAVLGLLFFGVFFIISRDILLCGHGSLRVSFDGGTIVKSIISANTEQEALGKESLWPKKGEYKTSTEFFAALLEANVVAGMSVEKFKGLGTPAAENLEQFRTGKYNVWNVVAGLTDDSADRLPFMFSKNFSITAEDLMNADPNDTTTDWSHKITNRVSRAGKNEIVVIVRKDAAVEVLRTKWLTPANVLYGERYTNDIEILKAVE